MYQAERKILMSLNEVYNLGISSRSSGVLVLFMGMKNPSMTEMMNFFRKTSSE